MNLKKLLALALALVMVFALAACGSEPAPTESGDPAPAESTSGEPTATIKVAALESAYEETYPGMWQEVCDAFTAQTGIAVELTVERNLEDVIGASMQGGDYPDVIHLATGREAGLTEQFINDKLIADITDMLDMTVPGEDDHRRRQDHRGLHRHLRHQPLRRRQDLPRPHVLLPLRPVLQRRPL